MATMPLNYKLTPDALDKNPFADFRLSYAKQCDYQCADLVVSLSRAPMARRAIREGSMTVAVPGTSTDENECIFRR